MWVWDVIVFVFVLLLILFFLLFPSFYVLFLIVSVSNAILNNWHINKINIQELYDKVVSVSNVRSQAIPFMTQKIIINEMNDIADYIENNVAKWQNDKFNESNHNKTIPCKSNCTASPSAN